VSSIKRASTGGLVQPGENFPYGFKAAPMARQPSGAGSLHELGAVAIHRDAPGNADLMPGRRRAANAKGIRGQAGGGLCPLPPRWTAPGAGGPPRVRTPAAAPPPGNSPQRTRGDQPSRARPAVEGVPSG
jgi:hypothetical protein